MNESSIITIIYNLLKAMEFFHSTNLMHRDIKPANILISPDCTVKLCDFGSARPVKTKQPSINRGHLPTKSPHARNTTLKLDNFEKLRESLLPEDF
jgi:serine/threonine protein kinase